jgi:predicted aldo/keto reductase-like oxidoreductase
MVNKFNDLTKVQDFIPESVRNHYELLEHHASECIACGQCLENCPFDVPIIEKMQESAEKFGL